MSRLLNDRFLLGLVVFESFACFRVDDLFDVFVVAYFDLANVAADVKSEMVGAV